MQGCKVAVIGGGPAGVLTAAHFAKRGARVTVYEKRTVAQQNAPGLGWTIALADVGVGAIEAAGLSSDFGPSARSEGMALFSGLNTPMIKFGSESISFRYSLTRAWIINHLREQCEANYPSLVTFEDGYSLVGGNLPAGEVILSPVEDTPQDGTPAAAGVATQAGGEVRVQADLVVAADGAGSKARSLLQETDSSLEVQREWVPVSTVSFSLGNNGVDPATYATLETPSGKPFKLIPEDVQDPVTGGVTAFCLPVKGAAPQLVFFILGCRCGGDDVNASLTATQDWLQTKRSVAEVQQILEESFPQMPRGWLQTCAEACCAHDNRGGRTSSFVECNKLGTGRCVLIGDAAHAVSPNLGYGATAGMADAGLLAKTAANLYTGNSALVSAESGDSSTSGHAFDTIADEWTRERLHDAHAYTHVSKSVSDMTLFKHHQDYALLLKALPLGLPHAMGMMKFRGKSLIAPSQVAFTAMGNGGMRPSQVVQAYHASFYKVVGVLGVLIAVGFTAAAKLGPVLLRTVGL